MRLRRRVRAYLDLIAWNLYVANSDANVVETLLRWIDKYAPDVLTLSECMTHADALREVSRRTGYELLQEKPGDRDGAGPVSGTGDTAILVAPGAELVHSRLAVMARLWLVFSHHRWHKPREYEVAVLRVRGRRWRVCAPHPPTNGFAGGNRAAFLESARWLRAWLLRTGPRTASVAAGDMNEKAGALREWFGRRFVVFGKGIDVAITRRVSACEWSELGKGGGDHHGRRYRFHA